MAAEDGLYHLLWRIIDSQQDTLTSQDLLLDHQREIIGNNVAKINALTIENQKNVDKLSHQTARQESQLEALRAIADIRDKQEEKLDNATTQIEVLERALKRAGKHGQQPHDPPDEEVYHKLGRFGEFHLVAAHIMERERTLKRPIYFDKVFMRNHVVLRLWPDLGDPVAIPGGRKMVPLRIYGTVIPINANWIRMANRDRKVLTIVITGVIPDV
ncbi:hypothetical protein F4778DRAFT_799095 [Xylariomycetidae sp. FL2044]|nr:hypothetical protein F4778DRAFT_799095 [Xylariomycetidae sp. FL2044]